jgi:hypothetical protein
LDKSRSKIISRPAIALLGRSPYTANARIHPSLSDYCRVTRDAAGEDLFGQRQAMLAGVVITVLTVIGLTDSIPYWHMLGILAPRHRDTPKVGVSHFSA